MPRKESDEKRVRIDRLDRKSVDARLREAAREVSPNQVMDNLELRHLTRVITECSLLLTDVYSEERIARIMEPGSGFLNNLVDSLIDEQRRGRGEALYRVRRLPDDVRVVGDKALFDKGLLGLDAVKGYDLEELGVRAYRAAGEALELLADDRRLRKFFRENRLLMLPLEEEVVFLRQCSDRFRLYAEILKGAHGVARRGGDKDLRDLAVRVPLMEAAAEALGKDTQAEAGRERTHYARAARGESSDADLSRDQLLSSYERMLLFSSLDVGELREALEATVIDQPQAVAALCDEFSLFATGTCDLRKPPAYFLVGPTGVGKNHLVESLCRLIGGVWSLEVPQLTIEGPNYTYASDINELRGATRGFIRSDEEGLLARFHEKSSRAPFSVILVDEVEKAHPQLLTFFLSILDRGTTTDNRGNTLNFSNCMLFFTSNLGYSDAQQRATPIGYIDEDRRNEAVEVDIRRDLRRRLKPEFVNRVRMIHFNRLTRHSVDRILNLELDRLAGRYESVHGLTIELDRSAREELIRRGFSESHGARHLAATLESVCNVELARKVRRDDRRPPADRQSLIDWLRSIRAGERVFDADEVRRRVLEQARASLDYDTLRIVFADGVFTYRTSRRGDGE